MPAQISYDELTRVYRLEKNTSRLVELPEDFYNALYEFMVNEHNQYLESLKDVSSSRARDFSNLRKMVEELFGLREKKVLSLALVSARTSDGMPEHLTLQEKELFSDLLEAINAHRGVLSGLMVSGTRASPGEPLTESAKDLNTLPVRILSEVPAFVGSDLKSYGPFQPGQTVQLPNRIAHMFVARALGAISD
ncbi:MAG: DNA replication complex GINS family protein [Candidatus Diapherotrites archaeon]|nr:DNA replication complex GINS family protein [Candidatus Diapherotrites archaeon]